MHVEAGSCIGRCLWPQQRPGVCMPPISRSACAVRRTMKRGLPRGACTVRALARARRARRCHAKSGSGDTAPSTRAVAPAAYFPRRSAPLSALDRTAASLSMTRRSNTGTESDGPGSSMCSRPSRNAGEGAAPPHRGSDTPARHTMEANKSAVGVAMQWLVFIDKVHDMHGSKHSYQFSHRS